jgi:hypothetical protein
LSQTCYWEAVRPEEPLGSWQGLKYLIFPEGGGRSCDTVIKADGAMAVYLRGYCDALPDKEAGLAEGRKAALTEFLDHLKEHGALRVWVDE